MKKILLYLPIYVLAFTITTEKKIGQEVYTNFDLEQENFFQGQQKDDDFFIKKALLKQMFVLHNLQLSNEEKENLYKMHLERIGSTDENFIQNLEKENLSKQAFLDEIAYAHNLSKWLKQNYAWQNYITDKELNSFKKTIESQNVPIIVYHVLKILDSKKPPEDLEKYWIEHSSEIENYEQRLTDVPEVYEEILEKGKIGIINNPIQAYGNWHIIKIDERKKGPSPNDNMIEDYLLDQKSLTQLSSWLEHELKWVYKS